MAHPTIIKVRSLDGSTYRQMDWFMASREAALANEYGVFIAESPKVIERAMTVYQPLAFLISQETWQGTSPDGLLLHSLIDRLPSKSPADEDVPIFIAPEKELKSLTGFKMTRGALAAMKRQPDRSIDEFYKHLMDDQCPSAKLRLAVLCHVVKPTNIGAIFRSAAALGIDGIVLSPDCCDPLYRRAIRVSMGTVFQIPWAYDPDLTGISGLDRFKRLGITTVSLALRDDTIPIDDPKLKEEKRLAILLGNEGCGLEEDLTHGSDHTVMIPMSHGVDSLNVAACSAVAFWELGNR